LITLKQIITKPVVRIEGNFALVRNDLGGYDRYNLNWYRIGGES
jgi:hypothetical protein